MPDGKFEFAVKGINLFFGFTVGKHEWDESIGYSGFDWVYANYSPVYNKA